MASIIRRIFGETGQRGTWVQADSRLTARILGYSGRLTDRSQIRETLLKRYGTGLRVIKDELTGVDYQVFVKDGFDVRLQFGHIETVCIGLGHKIASAIATLFSEQTQTFALSGPNESDASAASELIWDLRGERFVEALVQADTESIWVASMPILVEFVDGVLHYRVIDPGKVQVLFEESIESNGQTRPANMLDIEDATCVVINTGSTDDITNSYIAIFGRSQEYPDGRYVAYRSSGDGLEIPKPYADDTYDWIDKDSGEIANPLSLYANQNPDLDVPEYPIATIHSGLVRRETLFPVSDSMLQEALEADVAASHIRATSGDNSRGTRVFVKSETGATQPVPKSLSGEVILEDGQDLRQLNADSAAPKIAWELLQEEMVSTSLGFAVPDFYISSQDHTVEAASGVALRVRSGQLNKLRARRAELNAPAVDKIFEVEKIYVSMMADADDGAKTLLESCEQTWDPGRLESVESETEQAAAVRSLVDSGLYDTIEAIQTIYNLGSEAEAVEKYELLSQRRKKYPPLNQDEKDRELNAKLQSRQTMQKKQNDTVD